MAARPEFKMISSCSNFTKTEDTACVTEVATLCLQYVWCGKMDDEDGFICKSLTNQKKRRRSAGG